MFVKSILAVLLLSAFSAHANDFRSVNQQAQEFLSEVQNEMWGLESLKTEVAPKAFERAQRELRYIKAEVDQVRSSVMDQDKSGLRDLDIAIWDMEQTISQNLAVAIGVGVVQQTLQTLGKIELKSWATIYQGEQITRGVFEDYPEKIYGEIRHGLPAQVRVLKVRYLDQSSNELIEITATVGSQLQNLVQVKKWMASTNGAGVKEFLRQGTGVNFKAGYKASSGWQQSKSFHTYYYGLFYIGDIQLVRTKIK